MNVALIFAGGVGTRMNSKGKPKQFLELNGKPIIIHTIENFEFHPDIDAIAVVCVNEWIDYLKQQLNRFSITKVQWIVGGGGTAQESTRNGLYAIKNNCGCDPNDVIVLIHDGVRPLITEKVISDNITSVKEYGNAITVAPETETVIEVDDEDNIEDIKNRDKCKIARAPQSFILSDIIAAHEQSIKDGYTESVDSAMLMNHYGNTLHTVDGPIENIKITNPPDFYILRAILEAKENSQIWGL